MGVLCPYDLCWRSINLRWIPVAIWLTGRCVRLRHHLLVADLRRPPSHEGPHRCHHCHFSPIHCDDYWGRPLVVLGTLLHDVLVPAIGCKDA